MIKHLQQWEDELAIAQREAEFQERVVAATIWQDPKLELASSMFDPHGVEHTEEGNIFFPSSAAEFAEMAEMFAQEGVERSIK